MRPGVALLSVLLGVLGMAAQAFADEKKADAQPERIELAQNSPLLGGWTGKIGKHAVLVCFSHYNSSYYYASQLAMRRRLVLTTLDAQGRSWRESDMVSQSTQPTGSWTLDTPQGDVLEGKWSDPQAKTSLPIRLTRDKSPAGMRQGCDLRALQATLGFDPARIIEGGEQELSGIRYRTISSLDGAVSTIQFLDPQNAVHNEKLRKELQNQIKEGLQCQTLVAKFDSVLDWPTSYRLNLVSVHGGRWVSLREGASGDCGGAHPYAESTLMTVDIRTGAPLDVQGWVRRGKEGELPARLEKLVTARILKSLHATRGGEDCDDVYTGGESGQGNFPGYTMALGTKGLVFSKSLPHVVYACTEEVEIPFDELQPFLTKAGKEAVSYLQAR